MSVFKPMLAKEAPADLTTLSYPLIVQPKLDGIRCTIVGGKALSRTLKEIPNREIFSYLSRPEFEGLDGEIVVGDPNDPNAMQATSSFVMSKSKTGERWTFHVFDKTNVTTAGQRQDYMSRWRLFKAQIDHARRLGADDDTRVMLVYCAEAEEPSDVDIIEKEWLEQGYEGVILRIPAAPYKFGRSGKKGPLLKLKRFIDFEAKITGVFELMHNGNEAKTNALGRTERSTSKDGLVGLGTLGGFICEAINGPHKGQSFRVGTGFTAEQRAELWEREQESWSAVGGQRSLTLIGKTVKIKSFPVGAKDAPRFPVFLGFRDLTIDG